MDLVRAGLRKERMSYQNLQLQESMIVISLREGATAEKVIPVVRSIDQDLEVIQQSPTVIALQFKEPAKKERITMMLRQSIEIVRRRIDEFGTAEPNIQQQGKDRILIQLPGINDPGRLKELLGKTAKLTFRLVHPESASIVASGRAIPGTEILMSEERDDSRAYAVKKQVLLSGESLIDAQPSFDEYHRPDVSFRFDTLGGRKFAEITRNSVGQPLAIILDNKVISAPVIQGPIPGGRGVITGHFTVEQAHDLALLMRAGALPAPLKVLEERTVGPDLGADSIAAGKRAVIISIVMVGIFMILAYSFFGIIANIAVIMNLILLFGALSILQATLTLPGIAGIALTIGMAVDANVLIYERIKEEMRSGKMPVAAIEGGYTHAMRTIIDSNLTTLIGAGLLFYFGSGAIRGFGVTLSLGIVISMFTAITLTRLITAYWYQWRRPKTLAI
jgi:preprotein translocase subunit SecD